MMITVAVLGLGLTLFVLVMIALGRRRSQVCTLEEWERRRYDVNVEAFRSLLDPEEEHFLRRALPHEAFRQLQRRRLALAMKYARRISENAAMLMHLVNAANSIGRQDGSDQLRAAAIEVRINANMILLLLTAKWLFPDANLRLNARRWAAMKRPSASPRFR